MRARVLAHACVCMSECLFAYLLTSFFACVSSPNFWPQAQEVGQEGGHHRDRQEGVKQMAPDASACALQAILCAGSSVPEPGAGAVHLISFHHAHGAGNGLKQTVLS